MRNLKEPVANYLMITSFEKFSPFVDTRLRDAISSLRPPRNFSDRSRVSVNLLRPPARVSNPRLSFSRFPSLEIVLLEAVASNNSSRTLGYLSKILLS